MNKATLLPVSMYTENVGTARGIELLRLQIKCAMSAHGQCGDRSVTSRMLRRVRRRRIALPQERVALRAATLGTGAKLRRHQREQINRCEGLLCWQVVAPAQTNSGNAAPDNGQQSGSAQRAKAGAGAPPNESSYAPLTASERWRMYFLSAFGPGAILRAAAAGGISQWDDVPKEWKHGSEAYGDRFGSSFAEHVIRKTMESGAAALLHEDNRYFLSAETGFWKRTKHAIGSVFVARNESGQEHFAYSRFGAALGTAFISRSWQPPSENKSGDAAVNFGVTIAADMGWNMFKEFRPHKAGWRF